ncbi:MAG TPA: hypothetical protein VNI54_16895 [Thermoanaerobaculia bacterium]|nr:hypothetical protein [Thermoanaerobaculia bacterium]
MTALILALLATIVIETVAASLILRRFVWLPALGIQLMTWPIAQSLVSNGARLWLVEIGVTLAEIVMWRFIILTTWRRAAVVSLVANGITAAIAFAIRR